MAESIGLEAVLDLSQWNKAVKDYVKSIGEMENVTKKFKGISDLNMPSSIGIDFELSGVNSALGDLDNILKFDGENLKIGLDTDVNEAEGDVESFLRKFDGETIKIEVETEMPDGLDLPTGGGGLGMIGAQIAAATGPVGAVAGTTLAVVGAVGAAAFNMAEDVAAGQRLIQTQLGLTEEQAQSLNQVAVDVFSSGMTESVSEAATILIEAKKQMGNLNNEDLTQAIKAAKRFEEQGLDANEVYSASSVLMKQFGLSSEESLDFIQTGMQRGLNTSGDFLDSISEYSNLFAQNGFAASQFFSIMETGQQGGVLGVDKISDAFKEAGIRIQELDDNTLENLENIGVNVDAMFQGLQSGSVTVAEAMAEILPAIQSIENPISQNALGVQVFGTAWEDLGAKAFENLDLAKTGLQDMTGATDEAITTGQNLSEKWADVSNSLSLSLAPIGEGLQLAFGDFLTEVGPGVEALATIIGENFNKVANALGYTAESGGNVALIADTLELALTPLVGLIENLTQVAKAWGEGFDVAAEAIRRATQPFRDLDNLVSNGIDDWREAAELLETIGGAASFVVNPTGAILGGLGSMIPGALGFGGSFATGGIVPGPIGKPVAAIVHGGETITPANQSTVSTVININGIQVGGSSGGDVDTALQEAFGMIRQQIASKMR